MINIKEALTLEGLKYFYTQHIKPLKTRLSQLGTAANCSVVNNATTTVANTVLDGRMGKTLADKDANLQSQISSLNSALFQDLSKYVTPNYGWELNRVSFKKVGRLVLLNFFAHAANYSVNTKYTVLNLTLPSEYKPPVNVIGFSGVMSNGDWTQSQACTVIVTTDNKVEVMTPTQQTSGYLSGNLIWCARN